MKAQHERMGNFEEMILAVHLMREVGGTKNRAAHSPR